MTRALEATEHQEQAALVSWCEAMESRRPELRLLFAIPNGAYKSKAAAAKFQREGLRRGVPDIMLACARGRFHGLFLEMKREKAPPSSITPAQLAWRNALRAEGYRAEIAFGCLDAINVIESYLRD